MSIKHLIEKFDQINPNTESLYDVDAIIAELQNHKEEANEACESMFKIFERLEFGSYNSVLWSILHALEALPAYEIELIKSVYRKPNEFNLRMINRNLNSGQKKYQSYNYVSILKELLNSEKLEEHLKQDVREYLEMHPD